jgi:hypothetical protein
VDKSSFFLDRKWRFFPVIPKKQRKRQEIDILASETDSDPLDDVILATGSRDGWFFPSW